MAKSQGRLRGILRQIIRDNPKATPAQRRELFQEAVKNDTAALKEAWRFWWSHHGDDIIEAVDPETGLIREGGLDHIDPVLREAAQETVTKIRRRGLH
jgi:hypothetical protein